MIARRLKYPMQSCLYADRLLTAFIAASSRLSAVVTGIPQSLSTSLALFTFVPARNCRISHTYLFQGNGLLQRVLSQPFPIRARVLGLVWNRNANPMDCFEGQVRIASLILVGF